MRRFLAKKPGAVKWGASCIWKDAMPQNRGPARKRQRGQHALHDKPRVGGSERHARAGERGAFPSIWGHRQAFRRGGRTGDPAPDIAWRDAKLLEPFISDLQTRKRRPFREMLHFAGKSIVTCRHRKKISRDPEIVHTILSSTSHLPFRSLPLYSSVDVHTIKTTPWVLA